MDTQSFILKVAQLINQVVVVELPDGAVHVGVMLTATVHDGSTRYEPSEIPWAGFQTTIQLSKQPHHHTWLSYDADNTESEWVLHDDRTEPGDGLGKEVENIPCKVSVLDGEELSDRIMVQQ